MLCEQCRTELEPVMVACPKCGRPVGPGGQEADWKRQVKETVERHKAKRRRQSSKHEEDARQLTIFPETNEVEDEHDAAERKRRAEIRARVEQRLKRSSPRTPVRTSAPEDVGSGGQQAATAAALPLELEPEPLHEDGASDAPAGAAAVAETTDAAEMAELEWSTGDEVDPEADAPAAVVEFGLASPAERLIAGVIDVGFVSLIQLTLFYLTTHLVSRTLDALPTSAVVAMSVVGAVLAAAYFLFFWSLSGQTLGKLLTGCRVVDSTGGGALGASRAALRLLAAILSVLPLGAGLLGWWTDPERRGWHDRLASTHVVRG